MTFAFILRNPINHGIINRKLLVELVKYYGTRPEAGDHIAKLIRSLSAEYSQLTNALRDIRKQIDSGKVAVANYEDLQKIFQKEKLHMHFIGNAKMSFIEQAVYNSEIFALLKVQIGKQAENNPKTLVLQLISLLQKSVWE